MPNVRGENQTLITCPMEAELLQEIEGARGHSSRSQFIREAIAEKLRGMGYKVREDIVFPPDRAGNVAKIVGNKNTLNQTFTPASSARLSKHANYPKPKRKKKTDK